MCNCEDHVSTDSSSAGHYSFTISDIEPLPVASQPHGHSNKHQSVEQPWPKVTHEMKPDRPAHRKWLCSSASMKWNTDPLIVRWKEYNLLKNRITEIETGH